jgi:ketol-acid reductoisomerase
MHQQRHWNTRLTSLQEYFKDDTMAMIGYGSQGHGQGLNLRDNGLNVIVGVRKDGTSWKEAVQDGWQPGVNLFEIDEAVQKGTIVMNLLSDAAQKETWSHLKPMLTKGKVSQKYFPVHPRQIITLRKLTFLADPLLRPRFLPRLQGPHQRRGPHRH